ncbi:MAG: 3-oxoacyl-ACP synthase [Armatimonadetes bacterium RBG_16_58_9]|nr:MAG: 3-oxoacyl-ACP synthase [Armatimonadetes bacterium RBG_16_58_9]
MSEVRSAGLISVGSAAPEKVLTNADLEKIVDTSDEWIREMTGISERRMAEDDENTSDYAVRAAKVALDRAGLMPKDIDLIIVATVTGDMIFPATASIVQHALGVYGTPAFDLGAGCSGWVYGLAMANAAVASRMYERVLVIGADLLTKVTNWTDRGTCILFGDGAGAGIVAPCENGSGMLAFELGSDGGGAEFLKIPAGGTRNPCTVEDLENHRDKIYMEGREVFKFAVKIQGEAAEKALAAIGMTTDDVDMVIPHQANIRIIDSAVKRLGLPPEKVYRNLHKYGNTSAASIPMALDECIREGEVKKGDMVVTVGFGAGLTWAAGVMKWLY